MGHTAWTEPQCLYKGALYLTFTLYFQKKNTRHFSPSRYLSLSKDGIYFHIAPQKTNEFLQHFTCKLA